MDGSVYDLATLPGGDLIGAGQFHVAGGVAAPYIARYGCVAPACYPDCDQSTGPGSLDVFDFLCFQNAFAALDPYACDCDTTTGPNVCDVLDFICFQSDFAAGCP